MNKNLVEILYRDEATTAVVHYDHPKYPNYVKSITLWTTIFGQFGLLGKFWYVHLTKWHLMSLTKHSANANVHPTTGGNLKKTHTTFQ